MTEQIHTVPLPTRHARADKELARAFPEHSRVAFQRSFDSGLVLHDSKPIPRDYKVTGGMTVTFSFPDTKPAELKAVAIPLDVLYEDKHLLALNKAAGMVVHPGAGTGEDTLVHALLAHCKGSLSGIGGVERPGIVHRLDRETSGVILVAKNDKAHRGLAEQFSDRTVLKEYLALVSGAPELLSGSIKKAISVIKKRTGAHEDSLRELKVGPGGVIVGPILKEFAGIFSGIPKYLGDNSKIMADDAE